jgi:tetratricopeptide (TPR) repeat protein
MAVTFACFANSLGNGFVFDDNYQVIGNSQLRNIENVPKLLTASYRPIRDITYAIDFWLWGRSASGFHLTNVLIHLANTLLVFLLLRKITSAVWPSVIGALIFAVHPMQPDAVTYISGRRDVLFSFFFLASFLSYLRYHEKKSYKYLAFSLILWALSLMSKEMAASLPLFIFAWSFCEAWDKPDHSWRAQFFGALRKAFVKDKWLYVVLILAVAAFGYYTIYIQGGSRMVGGSGLSYWGGSFYANALTAICVHAWYLKQLVFPTPVVQYLGAFEVASTIADPRVILSIVIVGGVLVSGFVLLRRNRLMAFAIFSYFILLLPVSQIIPHHELLADHYLYLPLASFGLFVGLLVEKIASRGALYKRIAYGAVAFSIAALAVMTIVRNRDWKDEFTLWQAGYEEAPNSFRAAANLAVLHMDRNPNKAIELYLRSVELEPLYGPAYLGLADLMKSKDKARELEAMIEKARAMPRPEIITAGQQYYWSLDYYLLAALAVTKHNQGERDEAEQMLKNLMASNPTRPEAYKLLASLYRDKDLEKELDVYRKQAEANPRDPLSLNSFANRLMQEKRHDEAMPYLERVLALDAENFNANYRIGEILLTKNDCARARAFFATARDAVADSEQQQAVQVAFANLEQRCGR